MAFDIKSLGGEVVLVIGTVHAGKTNRLISDVQEIKHSKFRNGFMVFSNSRNTRDGSSRVASASGLSLEHVFSADAEDPNSIHHTIAKNEVIGKKEIILFDEGNLHTHKFIPVVKRLMSEERTTVVYGLDLTFRGESFGPMGRLQEITRARETITGKNLVVRLTSYCSVISANGEQCPNVAGYTLRLKKIREKEPEVKFFHVKGHIISGFTRAPYYGPTIIVDGSQNNIEYTTACWECFGELPGRKFVLEVLRHIEIGDSAARFYDSLEKAFGYQKNLPEVIAYTIEERRLDMHGGTYLSNKEGDHPTWEEAEQLVRIGKELDDPEKNTTLDVYRMIKNAGETERQKVLEAFKGVQGLERILSGLMTINLIKLKDARLTPTHYIMDSDSGMYIPIDQAM